LVGSQPVDSGVRCQREALMQIGRIPPPWSLASLTICAGAQRPIGWELIDLAG
jgi:hypothetical protein